MDTILRTISDLLGPAMLCLFGGLLLGGLMLVLPDRFARRAGIGWIMSALFGLAGGLVVTCLVILLGQVRDLTAPAEVVPPPGVVDCESIELDGSEEQLVARLQCEGVSIIGPCELDAQDREAFKRMGVEPPKCEL